MNGIYGTVKPADIDPVKDADIYYYFRPFSLNDEIESRNFVKLDSINLVKENVMDEDQKLIQLDGMYSLKLPVGEFSKKGVYTIYIKPKEIKTEILDVSVLYSHPDIRGVVLNMDGTGGIDDLSGYRIEYLDREGKKIGITRFITSSGRCAAKIMSGNEMYPQAIRYILGDTTSDKIFCTLTPSMAPSGDPNNLPFIGNPGDKIILVNTKFNPVSFEIEVVDKDFDTISNMLEGSQIRDLDNGIVTTYNEDNEKYIEHEYYTYKSRLGTPLYDVKKKRDDLKGPDYNKIVEE